MVFINQIRQKIGVMFGNPETTTGGLALKFYSSVRMDIRRIGSLKEGDQFVGNRTRVTVVKNKLAPPFKKAEFDIIFNEGISLEGDLIDLGLMIDAVQKNGAWYTRGDTRLGQGRERARLYLKENPDLAEAIRAEILSQLAPAPQGNAAPGGGAEGESGETEAVKEENSKGEPTGRTKARKRA